MCVFDVPWQAHVYICASNDVLGDGVWCGNWLSYQYQESSKRYIVYQVYACVKANSVSYPTILISFVLGLKPKN